MKNLFTSKDKGFWIQTVQPKPKLRTYISFKIDLKVEKRVCNNLPKNVRSDMAKLRCGVLPIKIETGRLLI